MKIMRFGHIHIVFIFSNIFVSVFFSYFREFLIEAFCVAHASYNLFSPSRSLPLPLYLSPFCLPLSLAFCFVHSALCSLLLALSSQLSALSSLSLSLLSLSLCLSLSSLLPLLSSLSLTPRAQHSSTYFQVF